jgi:ribosomal protein L31
MSSSVSSFCGSRTSALRAGAGLGRRAAAAPARGVAGAVMRKRDIHPEWFPEAKVFCNGVEVMTVGGTKQVCSELQKKALLLSLLCSNHSHTPAAAGVAHTHVILMSMVMQFAALVLQGLSSSPPPPVAAMACCLSHAASLITPPRHYSNTRWTSTAATILSTRATPPSWLSMRASSTSSRSGLVALRSLQRCVCVCVAVSIYAVVHSWAVRPLECMLNACEIAE